MGQVDKPFKPDTSELPNRYAQEALHKFPDADLDADKADKICADLEALAGYEDVDKT